MDYMDFPNKQLHNIRCFLSPNKLFLRKMNLLYEDYFYKKILKER